MSDGFNPVTELSNPVMDVKMGGQPSESDVDLEHVGSPLVLVQQFNANFIVSPVE